MGKGRLVIYGAADNGGRLAYDYLHGRRLNDFDLIGFIDDHKMGKFAGFPILGNKNDLQDIRERGIDNIVVFLMKDPIKRLELCLELEKMQFNFPNICGHNSEEGHIGKGVYVHESSVFLGFDQKVEDFTVIGPHTTIEGRTQIGRGSILCPYSFLGYNSRIGEASILYPRASILPGVKIGDKCVVGYHVVQKKDMGNSKRSWKH